MKKLLSILLLATCTLACRDAGLQHYWDKYGVAVDDYALTRDRFVQFAEKLNDASPQEAYEAIDALMDKLTGDEVSYYIYSEWFVAAFHSILSPVRNSGLFSHFAERLSTDGLMSESDYAPLQELASKDSFNLPGEACSIPALQDASGAETAWTPGEETLFLVVNLDCATCVAALHALSDKPGRHIALCFGHTPVPAVEGWEYYQPGNMDDYFDLDAAPFWFTVDSEGKVITPYTIAPEYNGFATPNNQ